MESNAKTIQIFLPDGEPRGIRIAEITTRIVQAVSVPRSQIDRIMNRPESEHIAVYFLFGDRDDEVKPVVYIGQTEDLKNRLGNHNTKKEFWRTAVFIISRTHTFTQAHIRYLEWYCIQRAKEVGRYALDNVNEGSKPFVTEPMVADLHDAFETMSTLLSALGFPVFDQLISSQMNDDVERIIFYCQGPSAHGSGEMSDDGFVVHKGTKVREEVTNSADPLITKRRDQLSSSGILQSDGSSFVFTEDFLFASPSQASSLVLGRNSNGWNDWKTSEGKSLDEFWRQDKGS